MRLRGLPEKVHPPKKSDHFFGWEGGGVNSLIVLYCQPDFISENMISYYVIFLTIV